jgi:hypothetical protein
VKVASPGWRADAQRRTRRTDQVVVLCGHYTDTAVGVDAEIAIAREERKPHFLLAGRAAATNRKPSAALTTDKLYEWTWPNLKMLIGGAR